MMVERDNGVSKEGILGEGDSFSSREFGNQLRTGIRTAFIVGAGVVCLAGGAYVGQQANENIELLKEAPQVWRYVVGIGTPLVTAIAGFGLTRLVYGRN